MERFDLLVIGAGSGGLVAASGAARLGLKVGLVEKDKLGGDCLWTGCVPSKTLIQGAQVAHTLDTAKNYGFYAVTYKPQFDRIMGRVWNVVQSIERHDSAETMKKKGVVVIAGEASFVSPHIIEVEGKRYKAKKFVIATGSRPFIPPIKGIEDVPYHTNETIFHLKAQPKSLIIAGGGPIGVELAQAFHRLGTEVVLVHSGDWLLSHEDDDVGQTITKILKDEGVKIITSARVDAVRKDGVRKVVHVKDKKGGKQTKISGAELLVATGRTRNVTGLNLEAAGVDYDSKGIKTDPYMRTTAKHIYAVGDCTDVPYMFTHVADYHAGIALTNMILRVRKTDYRALPWVTYTDPEVARVGMGEREAIDAGIAYRAYKLPFGEVDRAEAEGAAQGFIKMVTTPKGEILGVHIVGPHAGELLGEATLVVQQKINLKQIAGTIHAYPTLALSLKQVSGLYLQDQLKEHPWIKQLVKWLF